MRRLNLQDVLDYVEINIVKFHYKRIESLDKLKLSQVLKRKNPYLFKAKYVLTAEQIIKGLVDAHISSNEETIFGDWLEGLAIFINNKVYDGWKSGIRGIDLEFDSSQTRNIVTIKSGPNWVNSSQIAKMLAVSLVPSNTNVFGYVKSRAALCNASEAVAEASFFTDNFRPVTKNASFWPNKISLAFGTIPTPLNELIVLTSPIVATYPDCSNVEVAPR